MNKDVQKLELRDIRYVKRVVIGNVNPNNLLSDEGIDKQMDYLNRCLNDYPKGIIIGKDISVARFQIGNHELNMEKTTYHVGFQRKPDWMKD
ncbi:MAG: hypothetical protein AB9856_01435 [Cellulosilyticaceae bacterium]